ncbi:carbonic anhydrase [Glonium stellatum]|uniref:Carbonic anhydrase n=1 Tax=Glonium stellatum TaxID=574774 RepID=A0A8E2EUM0_9PEZI|nr:carbonic anhydrase [Glonium stellatum]
MFLKEFSGFLLFTSYATASCLHGTSHLLRRTTPDGRVAVSKFGYTESEGPLHWAGLSTNNSACAMGTTQSPINIDSSIPTAIYAPKVSIPSVQSAEFENLGSTVEVVVNGTATFNGTNYALKQFHFHTPSEHRINEEYFPLEMHMVHQATDNSSRIAVLTALFQLSANGSTTDLITNVTKNLAEITTPGTVTETGPLDFTSLITKLTTTPLLQYTGSLTTPPCAEGVLFLIMRQPLPLNVATYNALKSVIKFNSRYTQNKPGQQNLLVLAAEDVKNIKALNGTRASK